MKTDSTTARSVEAIYRLYGGVVYAHCRRLLKNDAQAEDAAQEVFLRVMEHGGPRAGETAKVEGNAALLNWLRRVATNHCLDRLRRRRIRGEDRPVAEAAEPLASPLHQLETRDLVRHLLQHTPELARAPAVLFHVEGLEQAEIAQTLRVSRRTVCYRLANFADRMHRARSALDGALA